METWLTHMRALSDGGSEGFIGLMATAFVVGWKVYRLPILQTKLPARVRWDNLTPVVQWSITIGASALGGVLTALTTGKSGWELVGAALRAIKDVLLA